MRSFCIVSPVTNDPFWVKSCFAMVVTANLPNDCEFAGRDPRIVGPRTWNDDEIVFESCATPLDGGGGHFRSNQPSCFCFGSGHHLVSRCFELGLPLELVRIEVLAANRKSVGTSMDYTGQQHVEPLAGQLLDDGAGPRFRAGQRGSTQPDLVRLRASSHLAPLSFGEVNDHSREVSE